MRSDKQTDMWDGVFDNYMTGRREVFRDGKIVRYAARNCCGDTSSFWRELHALWGTYAEPPHNGGLVSACIDG